MTDRNDHEGDEMLSDRDDSQLHLWLQGELDLDQQERLKQRLMREPKLSDRLAEHLAEEMVLGAAVRSMEAPSEVPVAKLPMAARWWIPAAAAMAMAAGVLVNVSSAPQVEQSRPILQVLRLEEGEAVRSAFHQVGESVRFMAESGLPGELRLYLPDGSVVRCPKDSRCGVEGSSVGLSWRFDTAGIHRVVWFHGSDALPEPTGDLGADAAAVQSMGADLEVKTLEVVPSS